MKTGDRLGHLGHEMAVQGARPGETVKQTRLIEADHLDQPLDGRSLAAETQAPASVAHHRGDPYVDVGRRPPVEGDFRLAGGSPERRGREIEVRETHGPLELVGAIARQEHHRDVGLDAIHRENRATVGVWAREERDHIGLSPFARRSGNRALGRWFAGVPLAGHCLDRAPAVTAPSPLGGRLGARGTDRNRPMAP